MDVYAHTKKKYTHNNRRYYYISHPIVRFVLYCSVVLFIYANIKYFT